MSNEMRWLFYYRNTSYFRLKNCQKYISFLRINKNEFQRFNKKQMSVCRGVGAKCAVV